MQPSATSVDGRLSILAIINVALTVSVFLGVLAVGLRVRAADLTYVFRRPSRLIRSLLAMNVLWPIVVVLVCRTFSLHPAVIVGLLTLSVAPVGALFSQSTLSYVGSSKASYARGLFFASTVLSVILTPLAVEVIQAVTGGDVHVKPSVVAGVCTRSVLLPLGIGLTMASLWPSARAWIPIIQRSSSAILGVCTITRLGIAAPYMGLIFRLGTTIAIVLMTLIGLAIGHVLGGPDEDDRTVLAFATISRHPGVAVAVANLTAQPLAPLGVLLAFTLSDVAMIPYKRWRKRRHIAVTSMEVRQPATRRAS